MKKMDKDVKLKYQKIKIIKSQFFKDFVTLKY